MSQVLCPKGLHFYNPKIHDSCPICTEKTAPNTQKPPADSPESDTKKASEERKTTLLSPLSPDEAQNFPEKIPSGGSGTLLISPPAESQKIARPETQKNLLAGWLVITEGPGLGTDFRLKQGENRIGLDEGLEVSLDFGEKSDKSISRQERLIVIYDQNANEFYIEKPDHAANGTLLLNKETTPGLQKLQTGDVFQIGKTKLLFIPLCGDFFCWPKETGD